MHIWEIHVWEMYVSKVQLACECVRGIWEIFDVAGGAECRKLDVTVAHRTAKAPTANSRPSEFAPEFARPRQTGYVEGALGDGHGTGRTSAAREEMRVGM